MDNMGIVESLYCNNIWSLKCKTFILVSVKYIPYVRNCYILYLINIFYTWRSFSEVNMCDFACFGVSFSIFYSSHSTVKLRVL